MVPRKISFILLGSLLLIGLPFFFFGGPGYQSGRSFQAVWDLGHILFFALFSSLLLGLLNRRATMTYGRKFALVFPAVFAVGLVVEILQMLSGGRTPDGGDLLRNQLGCLIAFGIFVPRQWAWTRLFRAGVAGLLLLALWPLSRALIDETLAARQFPVLADFETPFESQRWVHPSQLRRQGQIVRHGNQAVRVQLTTARFSGVSLFHFPGDWRGYRSLRFSVYNPREEPLELNCRIHDAHHRDHRNEFHDRYNQQFQIQQGWNDLSVPLDRVRTAPRDRSMDLTRIKGFGLFVVQQPRPLDIVLDHVFLSE
jgi:hypothetical protein